MTVTALLQHDTLNATLTPAERELHYEFRGIKYAAIPERWEYSQPIDSWKGQVLDCTKFGPKCPQPFRDVAAFYSLPADQNLPPDIAQDEFECLNLVVSVPKAVLRQRATAKAPVLIFIHGGAHAYTMVNIEQGFTDPADLIKQSLGMDKPVIVVHIAYRLNLLGFTVFKGRTNFAIHDQRHAIEWVQKHISGFGGDPRNISLSGESSGALDVHAHIHGPLAIRGIRRAILQSGSLYLTAPAPQAVGEVVMKSLAKVYGKSVDDLQTVPVGDITSGMSKLGIKTSWLHEEPGHFSPGPKSSEWAIADLPDLESVMIGDCQYESRGFEAGIMSHGLDNLKNYFSTQYREVGEQVASLYRIDFSSADAARPTISAFVNDVRFAFAVHKISRRERDIGKRKCYRYLMDQLNPWNAAAGAQHAIDLLFLYGGPYDYSHDVPAMQVSLDMREKWITFMYGEDPWPDDKVYAFGPAGQGKAIGDADLAERRRVKEMEKLDEVGWRNCQPLVTRLLAVRGKVEEAYDERSI